MSDEKNPPLDPFLEIQRRLLKSNSQFEHRFWMNASAAGKLFDLCHGSKELADEDGAMHPCIGCLGCASAADVPKPPVSGVRLK